MKKIIITFTILINLIPTLVFAQDEDPSRFTRTILPEVNKEIIKSNSDCRFVITRFEDVYFSGEIPTPDEAPVPDATTPSPETPQAADYGSIKRFYEALDLLKLKPADTFTEQSFEKLTPNDILGCAIVTGRIKMFYLSMILSYALNMLAIVSGSIAMLFIMFGGYQYVIGSLTQSTDNAKKTIINAVTGLIVSTGGWIIVNIVLSIISS